MKGDLARRALTVAAAALAVGTVRLAVAFVHGDFGFTVVADTTTRDTPAPYRLAALWGGMEASLLLWTTVVAVASAVTATSLRRRCSPLAGPFATAALALVTVTAVPLVTAAWPFERLAIPALDGGGLNPLLLHPAMLVHPPIVYLGYAGLAVPFALTLAGLWRGRLDTGWWTATRASLLGCWVLLAAGMALGARWAYEELGWGGFWAWDPVENAALVPWILVGAALHAPSARSRAACTTAAFLAGSAGVVVTRSGAADSVHAFAEAQLVGWQLLAGFVALAGATIALLLRRPGATAPPEPASRPPVDRAATVLLAALAVVVAFGTFVPIVVTLLGGPEGIAEPRFFVLFCAVPAAALVALLVVRGRRVPAGAALAHAGIVIVLLAATASALGDQQTVMLEPGDDHTVAGTTLRLTEVRAIAGDHRDELVARIAVVGDDGQRLAMLEPALHDHGGGRVTAEARLRSGPARDLLVAPQRIDAGSGRATVEVTSLPLAWWLWPGSALVVVGGLLAVRRRRQPAPDPESMENAPSPVMVTHHS